MRKSGRAVPAIARMKQWTTTKTPPQNVVSEAQRIAATLGIPYAG